MSKGQGFSLLLRKIDMLKVSVRKICELCVKLHVVFLCLFDNLEQNLNRSLTNIGDRQTLRKKLAIVMYRLHDSLRNML